MNQFVLAQVFVVAAIVLIVVHRWVTNRWLSEHQRRTRPMPGADWWRRQDPDPTVERWRRLRILVLVPTAVAFASGLMLLISSR